MEDIIIQSIRMDRFRISDKNGIQIDYSDLFNRSLSADPLFHDRQRLITKPNDFKLSILLVLSSISIVLLLR